jgi:prepilin-type N-terminal cleavage/methylation domain-containing protein
MISMRSQSGFSLVELSIVLVILGLLTGGILGGQALIRAAELRAATSEYQRYQSALNTFRDKYLALPGDMPNAVRFWGVQAGGMADGPDATCAALTTSATGTATCNGDGDGRLNFPLSSWYERYRFWQQLANAGLIEGTYGGVTAGTVVSASESATSGPKMNVPKSKLGNGAWYFGWWGTQTGSTAGYWAGDFGNVFLLGTNNPGSYNEGPLVKPEEAWNIDTKMDDGLPGMGAVTTLAPGMNPNCSQGGASTAPQSATYRLSDTSVACSIMFKASR